jgi:hypothetical protein
LNIITYSLRECTAANDSGNFYDIVDQLTDLVLHKAEACGVADIARQRIDEPFEEYVFELLALGVLWNTYKGNAKLFPIRLLDLYQWLYKMRSTYCAFKPTIDKVRGLLTSILVRRAKLHSYGATLESFRQLFIWLEATCEYREEVKRFRQWEHFFTMQPTVTDQLEKIELFAAWFEEIGQAYLGPFTRNVSSFLAKDYSGHRLKEDAIFCGRKIAEYHLNMVGATIMNRTFRPRFLQTERKVVLLPFCMSINAGGGCKSVKKGNDIICTGCTATCRIKQIKQLGENAGFEVFIVPHSSGFTKWLEQWRDQTHTGVVAVACVLNLLAGGYEMKSLHIPAQCVFLDYCGCKKHWCHYDLPTDIDEKRLLKVVGA